MKLYGTKRNETDDKTKTKYVKQRNRIKRTYEMSQLYNHRI